MILPEYALQCIRRLESAGFAAYAVGGCVRDACLGLQPHDYDLCTSAKPAQIKAIFADLPLVTAGEKHGTIGVVVEGNVVEITTFRTEGGYTDSRHPTWVEFVDDITGDLARRDLTVNAMAYSPTRGFADPFGGREDLKNGILRAVGDPGTRFTEDALRILRAVRFSVRYGLRPEAETEAAMLRLAPLMEHLARERVFDELCKLLPAVTAEDLLRWAPILCQVMPELTPCIGFDQQNYHHLYDVFTHTAKAVEHVPGELALRWAALLHDIGKPGCFTLDAQGVGHFYGHEKVSAEMASAILRRLKAPTALRQRVVFLIEKHMAPLEPDKKYLRRRLSRWGMDAVRQLLALQRADRIATGTEVDDPRFARIEAILAQIEAENACLTLKDLAIGGRELMALGYSGPAIGQTLNRLLELVIDEQVENEKDALLQALKEQ
jgi:tRNA nucleotidyltransferase (CCA-adding enzyme)